MDLVLLVDFLPPVTLRDNRKSITPMSQSRDTEGRPEMGGTALSPGARVFSWWLGDLNKSLTSPSPATVSPAGKQASPAGLTALATFPLIGDIDDKLTRSGRNPFLLARKWAGALRESSKGKGNFLKSDQRGRVPGVGSQPNHPHPPTHHSFPHSAKCATHSVTQQTSE